MPRYYPLRRVPGGASASYRLRQIAAAAAPALVAAAAYLGAEYLPLFGRRRAAARARSARLGQQALEDLQRQYFAQPGLDTLTVRQLSRVGRAIAAASRAYLWGRVALGHDKSGAAQRLQLVPHRGYDALLVVALALGRALGYFRGGTVHSQLWWDSATEQTTLPAGHPVPQVRRFDPPQTLADLAADIDDRYWSGAWGQTLKITRVGEGKSRRWLVSLPGTDHPQPESTPNPADNETNTREQLGLSSAMRVGVVQALHQAMEADGIAPVDRINERVLICGHSQGGMVAVALAATDPAELGLNVDAVLTLGSPTRRYRLRPEVAMLALEHDQDVVPSMDGTTNRQADQRVVLSRRLAEPLRQPLYYAHSSATYTDTVRITERRDEVAPWGRSHEVIAHLQGYLPQPGEATRVTEHYIWQDLVPSRAKEENLRGGLRWGGRLLRESTGDIPGGGPAEIPAEREFWTDQLRADLPGPQWQPATFGDEVELSASAPPLPAEVLQTLESALGRGLTARRRSADGPAVSYEEEADE